ncbi:MAG: hypothetical protein WBE48_27675 [Xanthobacteraceae bacterium]|jgi:hypothetical protein
MKFLAKLATGQIALWRVYWLIGTPLTLIWLVTGAAMLFWSGASDLFVVGFIIAVFTLAALALPFVAWAIWRSASNYPRKTWWHTAFAWGAKLCAAFTGLVAALSVVGLLYLGNDLIQVFLS